MSRPPLILLPPSEGKASGGSGRAWESGTMAFDLDDARREVAAVLSRTMRGSEGSRAKLLGVKGKALGSATAANSDVLRAATMPAIERYTGVLYEALDHRSLDATHRKRLDSSVVIFSGLWGLVTPSDQVPDYKLKMGASLPTLGKLSTWWRHDLSLTLGEAASGRRVWNLLPIEHAVAWRPPEPLEQYSVRFLERRPDGSLKAVSHWNKLLKGALVRFLVENPSAEAADLTGWKHPSGYRYRPKLDETSVDGITVLIFVED